jgi:hypothetical protein
MFSQGTKIHLFFPDYSSTCGQCKSRVKQREGNSGKGLKANLGVRRKGRSKESGTWGCDPGALSGLVLTLAPACASCLLQAQSRYPREDRFCSSGKETLLQGIGQSDCLIFGEPFLGPWWLAQLLGLGLH